MDNRRRRYMSNTGPMIFTDQHRGHYGDGVTVAAPPPLVGGGYFTPLASTGHHDWTTNNNPSSVLADASGSSSHAVALPATGGLACLKLGKRHCFEDVAAEVSDDAGGGRRAREAVRCLVDGCEAALGRAREYHRRHRVCELHTKAPVVVVLGRHQRFCQQCSRFHAVSEFDDSKRSCRRRLAGHNERRRKPASSQGGAPSLLSSRIDTGGLFGLSSPSDLSLQCGAALRELIAEHRATILARQQLIHQESGPRSSSLAWGTDVETGSHVTHNHMQRPSRLLSVKPKQQHEDRCCLLWN